jgi:hypothetical protein
VTYDPGPRTGEVQIGEVILPAGPTEDDGHAYTRPPG